MTSDADIAVVVDSLLSSKSAREKQASKSAPVPCSTMQGYLHGVWHNALFCRGPCRYNQPQKAGLEKE